MGREATCACTWGDRKGNVGLRLEGSDLIVRGAVRLTVPIAAMDDMHADGDRLRFRYSGENVALDLGRADAARWAKAIATPPPSLAKKLGIAKGTRVAVVGHVDDPELTAALAQGEIVRSDAALVVVRADDERAIETALTEYGAALRAGTPIWIVYQKGRESPYGETAVRAFMRARHLVDLKVASVSPRLTALRFGLRPEERKRPAPAARVRAVTSRGRRR